MKLRSLAAAILLALTLGCGRIVADHVVTGTPMAARYGGPVQVVMENQPVPPMFTEVALVRARGEGNRANLESVLGALQEEARLVGANAVVRVRIDQGAGSVSALGTAGVVQ
jgi:hypothetical protein